MFACVMYPVWDERLATAMTVRRHADTTIRDADGATDRIRCGTTTARLTRWNSVLAQPPLATRKLRRCPASLPSAHATLLREVGFFSLVGCSARLLRRASMMLTTFVRGRSGSGSGIGLPLRFAL